MELLDGIETLAIDGLRLSPPHPTHFTIGEAIDVARQIGPRETWLIHLTHDIDHASVERTLPEGAHLAYDGLVLRFGNDER
jgi:phosphoribosyl 1,2-cyclic phosphate phosphodiesterase